MRVPYKYPYVSMFIISYYLLEHQGYYYKLRKYFGYKEIDEIDFIVRLNQEKFRKMAHGTDRKMLVYCGEREEEEEVYRNFNKAARTAKEKKRSPVVFSYLNCQKDMEMCMKLNSKVPSMTYLYEGEIVKTFDGPFTKRKILKFLKRVGDSN